MIPGHSQDVEIAQQKVTQRRSQYTRLTRNNLGYLLAKAVQSWNKVLYAGFCDAGFAEVKPSYGSILIPLFEQDGLRMGDLARRARLSKQTMTTLIKHMEQRSLVVRRQDPNDGRATLVYLTRRSREFEPVAEEVLAQLEETVEELLSASELKDLKARLRRLQLIEEEAESPSP